MTQAELERRQRLYGDPEPAELSDRPLIVVDDGVATGMTALAALRSLQLLKPASLLLAVPVIDHGIISRLQPLVDRIEALAVVEGLRAVGEWYESFPPVGDDAVLQLLHPGRDSSTAN